MKRSALNRPHHWYEATPIRTWMGLKIIVYICAKCGRRLEGKTPSYTQPCKKG